MKTMIDRFYVWGFVSILGVMSTLFFLLPKQAFSDMENRSLQTKPELTWDRLVSKQFADEAELYVSDHFPFRTNWVIGKSMTEQLRLQKENNGIYKGSDGYLFEKFLEPDYAELVKYTDAIKQFAANHQDARIRFLLAPNSIGLYPERLPWMASAYSQREVNDFIGGEVGGEVSFMNGFDILQPAANGERPVFYRTDHHWTTYGAYLAYRAYAQEMGWRPLDEEDYEIRSVTRTFLGSYHTRSQFGGLKADSIEVYEPKRKVASEMHIVDNGETKSSLYDGSSLGKKDKYAYFQGGVHALVKVTNALAATDSGASQPGSAPSNSSGASANHDAAPVADLSKLLIVKDSYAHSFLPFLTQHVEEIHMIDIRFYNGNIGDYMEENGIEDVLLLFNTSTFIGERNLLKLRY